MTSVGYGDIIPNTDVEKAFALLVMIVGATTYAGLFGAFAVIVHSLNAKELENRELLT